MEFKDKLKEHRKARGISQQSLADSIFVSRSAVAKWENGLGLPCEESLAALAEFFGVDEATLRSDEPEMIIVEKNKHIRRASVAISAVSVLLLTATLFLLMVSVFSNSYGFTSEMAAGTFGDNPCISTDDYDFYLSLINVSVVRDPLSSYIGSDHREISSFRAVRPRLIGYSVVRESDYECRRLLVGGKEYGCIYIFSGKKCFYSIIKINTYPFPEELMCPDTIEVGGKSYPVLYCTYFESHEYPDELKLGTAEITLGEELDRAYIMPGGGKVIYGW